MERFEASGEVDGLPTPEQLRKLSKEAISAAGMARKLTRLNRLEPTYGWVEQYSNDGEARTYERFSGRVARRAFTAIDASSQIESVVFLADRWSMRYRELSQQYVMHDFWLSELKTYSFEWDKEAALLSQCHTKVVPSIEQSEIDSILSLSDEAIEELALAPTESIVEIVDGRQVGQLTGAIRRRRRLLQLMQSNDRMSGRIAS